MSLKPFARSAGGDAILSPAVFLAVLENG